MKKKINIKKVAMYVFYVLVTVCILAFVLSLGDVDEMFMMLGSVDMPSIGMAFLMLAIYMATYPLSLVILTRARHVGVNKRTTYNIAMTEHFFNGITPFATGGQPFQVYSFSKAKVKAAESTSLLLMNFMVFMLVTNGFAACALIYFRRLVTDLPMALVAAFGFIMNFAVLGFTMLIAMNHKVAKLLSKFVDFLAKRRMLSKFLAPRAESMKTYFAQVQEAFSNLLRKKGVFLGALLTKILSMGAYYSTTFFILRALHIDVPPSEFFYTICATSFAITMVVFLPTPGSSGGIEFAFKSIFATIAVSASAATSYSGMLIWRLLTYYIVMLVSLIFYIALEVRFSRKAHRAAEVSAQELPTEGATDEKSTETEGIEE